MKREELKKICKDIRKDILFMISNASSGHPGGSLSAVEILVTLYFEIMNLNEIFKANGIEEKVANAIISAMKENKIYTPNTNKLSEMATQPALPEKDKVAPVQQQEGDDTENES